MIFGFEKNANNVAMVGLRLALNFISSVYNRFYPALNSIIEFILVIMIQL